MSNSAIHHGNGYGIQISQSSNILIQNNTVFDVVKFGINTATVKNITIDLNWVFGVYARHIVGVMQGDPMGAILGCADVDVDYCY